MAVKPAEERPIGFGRLRRQEDVRFIRGQGRYVDEVQLPGRRYGAALGGPLDVDTWEDYETVLAAAGGAG